VLTGYTPAPRDAPAQAAKSLAPKFVQVSFLRDGARCSAFLKKMIDFLGAVNESHAVLAFGIYGFHKCV